MNLKAILVEKTSKNGSTYIAVELYLTENVKKLVFLNETELELIKLASKHKQFTYKMPYK